MAACCQKILDTSPHSQSREGATTHRPARFRFVWLHIEQRSKVMAWDGWGLLIVHDWNVQKPIPGYMSIVLTAPPGCISSHNSKIA
eukprot:scaffold15823_cov248-Alexandrium_tamarense.AAC.2